MLRGSVLRVCVVFRWHCEVTLPTVLAGLREVAEWFEANYETART